MLELLATHAIFNANTASVLTDTANSVSSFYDDGLGWCSYSGTLGGYCIVQLDGGAYLRAYQPRANKFALDLQRGNEYIIHDSLFSNALYLFDKRAGARLDLLLSGPDGTYGGAQVRAQDRWLSVSASSVQWRPLDFSGSWTTETTLTGTSGANATWSRTASPDVLAIAHENGTIVYYDVAQRLQVRGVSYIESNQGAWYSRKHDVFIARTSAHQIKVYASAVRPDALSNPAALSTITQGQVSQVRVRLLGANSDPCAGELIDWAIASGGGSMALAQSTTDADGYAYNDYVAPVASAGSVTIRATVLY